MRPIAFLLAPLIAGSPLVSLNAAPPRIDKAVVAAVADPTRPADQKATDSSRKPAETLAFAGVRRGMTIGEFFPGGGYYTRMLSDVVGPSGYVYGLENAGWKGAVEADKALLADGQIKNVSMDAQPIGTVSFPRPLDMAWVTQNYHDLKVASFGKVDTLAFDRAVFAALKRGGTFFILDHQGPAEMTAADIEKMHRINRDVVVREVTAAGFKLVGEGNFLRRPGDDHTRPIFDEAVRGQTDQYALKFVKPRR